MRKFKCKNNIGLLGKTYAEMFYSNLHQMYYIVLGNCQMGYKDEQRAIADLKSAGFEEIIDD